MAGDYGVVHFGVSHVHLFVVEWCADGWHGDYYEAPKDGSAWVKTNWWNEENRVVRGGGWVDAPRFLRSACRRKLNFDKCGTNVGFRVAMTL